MAFEADFFAGIRRVIMQVMFADGRIDPDEFETARDLHWQITGETLSEEVMRDEVFSLTGSTEEDLLQYLAVLSRNLNKSGKEMIVRTAYWVASGDEDVEESEESLVFRIGRALHMDRAQIRKVVEQSRPEDEQPGTWH